jgi:hypothetical protein
MLSQIYIRRYVKQPLIWPGFNEIWVVLTDFRSKHIKYHADPSNGSQGAPCGRKDRRKEGWTDRPTGSYDEANIRFSEFWERT